MQSGFQELLDEFLLEARERADEVENLLLRLGSSDSEVREAAIARVKRELHTLKGNSGMMGFGDLQALAHSMEDRVAELEADEPQIDGLLTELDEFRHGLDDARPETDEPGAAATGDAAPGHGAETDEPADAIGASVRVPFVKIDQLVELQAETLIFRNRLSDSIRRATALLKQNGQEIDGNFLQRSAAAWEDVETAQQMLEKVLHQLQDQVTNLGMVPLRSLFRSLRRIVHDESQRAGKNVALAIEGGDTPIDKTLLETASEALGHLVRNAVIHGLEAPAMRLKSGKSETGTVRLKATIEGGEIRIDVADDGAGVNVEALAARGRQLMGDRYQEGSDLALLFEAGLSTHGSTDMSAGRGVGLSAVKRSAESHGGRVEVRTQRGLGTSFSLCLPVTASILRSLLLQVDGEDYALPLTAVIESTRLSTGDLHQVNQAGVMRWRDKLIPLLDLGLTFGTCAVPREQGFVVVIETAGRYRGLAIDSLVGIRDIVVRGLDSIVGQPVGISGSTVLGDGRVIMILDPAALAAIPPFVEAES